MANRASYLVNTKRIFLSADPEVVGHAPPAQHPREVAGPLPDAEVVGQPLPHPEVVRLPLLQLQPVLRPGGFNGRKILLLGEAYLFPTPKLYGSLFSICSSL